MKKILAVLLALCIALSMTVLAPIASAQAVDGQQAYESAATPDEVPVAEEAVSDKAPALTASLPPDSENFSSRIRVTGVSGIYVAAAPDGNVVLSKNGSTDATMWDFALQSSGYYIITNRMYNKCLDVYGGGSHSSNVQIWEYNGSAAQNWWLGTYNGSITLRPACATDCALGFYNGSAVEGASLGIYSIDFSRAQLFTLTAAPADAPQLVKLINSNGYQKLSWTAGSVKPAKYRVYIKSGSSWKKLADTTATTYSNKFVKSGTTYSYTVRGLNKSGKTITAYDTEGLTLKYIAPPQFKLSNVNGGVRITWSKVKGAENYRVLRMDSDGNMVGIGDTTELRWTNKDVKSGKKYTYAVRCISKDGTKNTSAYVKKSIVYIAQPKISKISYSASGHVIKWSKITGAAKYRVYVKSGSKWVKAGDTAKTTYTYKKAKVGKKYTYTVRCITKDGKKVTSSYDTKGKSFKTLKAPKIKEVSRYYSFIRLEWNKVAGAKAYRVYYRIKSPTGKSSWSNWYELTTVYQGEYSTYNYYYHYAYGGSMYQYRVRCITDTGAAQSAYSKNSEGIRFCKTPHIYQGCRGEGYLRFYWYGVSGAYKYKTYVWDDAKNKWKTLGTTFSNVYYYYTNHTYGTHKFAVRAIDSEGHNMSELATVRFENNAYGFHIYSTP